MSNQQINRPSKIAMPMQRPIPATFGPIEDLARKYAEYRRFPVLPDTVSVVDLMIEQERQATGARAHAVGLATIDLPETLSPEQADGLRLLERARWTRTLLRGVGAPTLNAINEAGDEYGVRPTANWVYLQWVYEEYQGHKIAYHRVILPWHFGEGGGGFFREDVCCAAFPVPWDDMYRGYRFDVFGKVVKPSADASIYPLSVRWGATYEQDRNQPVGDPENGISVLLNGRIQLAAYRARAFHPSSPVYAQVEWRPGRSRAMRSTVDPTDDHEEHDRTAAAHGLELLDRLRGVPDITLQGKKPGDGATWTGNDDFLDDLWSTIAKYRQATGVKYPKITGNGSNRFRQLLRRTCSSRTLSDWLTRVGLRAQDIESGRITRENYSQLFSK